MHMLKSLALGAGALALTSPSVPAIAQTNPNLTQGQKLTPAQWNNLFASKQDTLGYVPLSLQGGVMTGRMVTSAPGASTAGFNLTPGTTPASPVNGDLWVTSAGIFARINGSTVNLVGASSASFGGTPPITVSFPAGVVTYAFDFTVANTFLAPQTNQGATTTSPGWYAQLTGDTNARVRVGLNVTDIPSIGFGPGNAARDTFLERLSAGNIRHGSVDSASPVAQTISVQNVVAGTTNTAGAALTISGSRGTGTGAGGAIVFQTAPSGSTGSTQNALVSAVTINPNGSVTVTSTSAAALIIGPNGTTSPTLSVDTSTASSVTGILIKSSASGGNAAISVTSTATNEALIINAKNAGGVAIGGASTGGVALAAAGGGVQIGSALTYGGVTLNNAVTGTGNMMLSTGPTASALTVTGSFTATGLVTNADLVNSSTTVNGQSCALGGACTVTASATAITVGSTVVSGGPGILYNSTGGGTLTALAAVNSAVVSFTSGGVLQASTTLPSGISATNMALTTPAIGVATGTSLALGGATLGANALAVTGSAAISSTLTSAAHTITSASAAAFAVGLNGGTNSAFVVDASTALSVTGILVKSAVSGGAASIIATSSAATADLVLNAKGAAIVYLGFTSSGGVNVGTGGGGVTIGSALTYGSIAFANTVTGSAGSSLVGSISPTFTGTVTTAITNATTGFQLNGAATSANYLRGNGTNFVSSAIQAGDLPLATNAAFGAMRGDGGATISCSAGVCSAVGASATAVTLLTTTVTGGTVGNYLTSTNTSCVSTTPCLTQKAFATPSVSSTQSGTLTIGASQTYNVPAGTLYLRARAAGGGGGGAGSGTSGQTNGGNGGDTTLTCNGVTITASGGVGSAVGGNGGAGGSAGAVGNVLNSPGQNGQGPLSVTSLNVASGAQGGSTALFGGGGVGTTGAGGSGKTNTGGGGAGGGTGSSAFSNQAGGGAGQSIEHIFTSLTSTCTYTTGTAGTAGALGTSGNAGGAGATGPLVIEAFSQ